MLLTFVSVIVQFKIAILANFKKTYINKSLVKCRFWV